MCIVLITNTFQVISQKLGIFFWKIAKILHFWATKVWPLPKNVRYFGRTSEAWKCTARTHIESYYQNGFRTHIETCYRTSHLCKLRPHIASHVLIKPYLKIKFPHRQSNRLFFLSLKVCSGKAYVDSHWGKTLRLSSVWQEIQTKISCQLPHKDCAWWPTQRPAQKPHLLSLWFGLYDGIDSEEAFKNSHWGKTPSLQVLQQRFHPKGPKEFL